MKINTSQLILIENEENSICYAPMHAIIKALSTAAYSLDANDMRKGRAIKFINDVLPVVLAYMAMWGKRVDKKSLKAEIQLEKVKSAMNHFHEHQVADAEKFLNALPANLDEADKAYEKIESLLSQAIDVLDIYKINQ